MSALLCTIGVLFCKEFEKGLLLRSILLKTLQNHAGHEVNSCRYGERAESDC